MHLYNYSFNHERVKNISTVHRLTESYNPRPHHLNFMNTVLLAFRYNSFLYLDGK